MIVQSGIQETYTQSSGISGTQNWIDYLNNVYNSYLQNKNKTETTYNSNNISGQVRGLIEAFNNPVGYLIVFLIIFFIYKRK